MQIKLEVLSLETVSYRDKQGKDASFEVINCREASPPTVLLPVRLAARDFPTIKAGQVVTINVSAVRCGKGEPQIGIRGALVNGVAK